MKNGWYKQRRDVCDMPWAKDSKAVHLYLYLHCHAYVQDQQLRNTIIRRGSCPTSRSAIMEATGLSEHDVKTRLKKLLEAGEIIVNSSNLGTIITLCDYDSYATQNDIFDENLSSGLPNQSPNQSPTYIEYRKEDNNLRSHYIPSKIERDNTKALIYEIKDVYNRMFNGVLAEWKRLSDKMVAKVEMCIARFGRQSIDMVFDQILHEQTCLNKNGFVPNFDFIFSISQYGIYLERYKVRQSQPNQAEPQQNKTELQQKSVGIVEEKGRQLRMSKEDYERTMRQAAANGNKHAMQLVEQWDRAI